MRHITSLTLAFWASTSTAQCVADAGPDTVVCLPLGQAPDTLQLGGDPAASGGVPPYSFFWSGAVDLGGGALYTADMMLDDVTSPNPRLVYPQGDVWFTLTVTDSAGMVCTDSVHVSFSVFATTLGFVSATIALGDSFQFLGGENVESNHPPMSFVWHPNTNMSDSTSLDAWVWPTNNTAYSLTATDSLGCTATGGPFYFIDVIAVDVREAIRDQPPHIAVVQRGTELLVQISGPIHVNDELRLFDPQGKLITNHSVRTDHVVLDIADRAGGVYYITLEREGASIAAVRAFLGRSDGRSRF